jgi:hypothetical protein
MHGDEETTLKRHEEICDSYVGRSRAISMPPTEFSERPASRASTNMVVSFAASEVAVKGRTATVKHMVKTVDYKADRAASNEGPASEPCRLPGHAPKAERVFNVRGTWCVRGNWPGSLQLAWRIFLCGVWCAQGGCVGRQGRA